MIKLAYNDKATLVKTNGEYYILYQHVQGCIEWTCLNSQSAQYNALTALESFKKSFGEPTFVRKTIGSC